MNQEARRDDPTGEADGVRVVYDDRRRLPSGVPMLAIVVVTALAALLLLRGTDAPDSPVASAPPARLAGDGAAASDARRIAGDARVARADTARARDYRRPVRSDVAAARADAVDLPPQASDEAPGTLGEKEPPPEVDAGDFITALRESGETGGLAAFPLPGTRPPRAGVIVPPDYELPEGYARHHQTTDDGQPLAPILVLAPGYEILDEAGAPIALTDGRIVPPELAPPDLPVHVLEVPGERAAGDDAP